MPWDVGGCLLVIWFAWYGHTVREMVTSEESAIIMLYRNKIVL